MNYSKYILSIFSLITLLAFTTACSTATEDHEQEPVGLVLYAGNEVALTQNTNGTISDTLQINLNSTLEIRIAFLDETETPFTPDPAEHGIVINSSNGTGQISTEANSSNPFIFDLSGAAEGEATFTVTLLHEGASEFVSRDLPVNVNIQGGN